MPRRPRISTDTYLALRRRLFDLGYRDEWQWAQDVQPPTTARAFAFEAIWVVCASGFREQAARVCETAVLKTLKRGGSATEVYPTSGKGRAIDRLWSERKEIFADFKEHLARQAPPEETIAWIGRLPYVGGKILRYHFAKNVGIDCVKPDRHLCRLAGVPEDGSPPVNFKAAMKMLAPIAEETGDRIATVDVVLWRACNLGLLGTDDRGRIRTALEEMA